MSLGPVAKRLHELLKLPVEFANDCVGPETLESPSAQTGSDFAPGKRAFIQKKRRMIKICQRVGSAGGRVCAGRLWRGASRCCERVGAT